MRHFDQLQATVRELVAEDPDFTYTEQGSGIYYGPSYLGRSLAEPGVGRGCIFGQAMEKLGVPRYKLQAFEENDVTALLDASHWRRTEVQDHWATTLQTFQDNGRTWKEALDETDKAFPSVNPEGVQDA